MPDIQRFACLGKQDTIPQDSGAGKAGRARRAKRGGNPIYPHRAFLAFLVLHASRSINAGGIFQHPATFIPSITIEIPLRRPLIIGNWKMNKTASEAAALIRDLRERVPASPNADVVLAPPFTALESARNALGPSSWISLGAQNVHWETHGAFTGEVSAPMLCDLGCRYVIVGHSERRTLFGERDESILKKVRAALRHGLSPILCVGESLAERESGRTESVVTTQLDGSLAGLTPQDLAIVTIAYEPVWAIGTGRAATTEQAVTVHRSIRLFIETGWDSKTASTIRILYGGSVTPQNIESLLASDAIDGALVGGACLNTDSFATIVSVAQIQRD
jgi:triosephosphate isomerase (TIM)